MVRVSCPSRNQWGKRLQDSALSVFLTRVAMRESQLRFDRMSSSRQLGGEGISVSRDAPPPPFKGGGGFKCRLDGSVGQTLHHRGVVRSPLQPIRRNIHALLVHRGVETGRRPAIGDCLHPWPQATLSPLRVAWTGPRHKDVDSTMSRPSMRQRTVYTEPGKSDSGRSGARPIEPFISAPHTVSALRAVVNLQGYRHTWIYVPSLRANTLRYSTHSTRWSDAHQ